MRAISGLPPLLSFGLRNVLRQRTRTGLALAAIALGVASLILTGGYVEDILYQLREATIRSQIGHLQIYRAGFTVSGGTRPFDYLIEEPIRVDRLVREVNRIAVVAHRLAFSGLINNGRGDLPVVAEGIEPAAENRIGSFVTILRGRSLASDDRHAIVLGEGLAVAMKLNIGDEINLVVSARGGALNTMEFQVVGVFRSMSKEYDARAVRIPLAAAAELVDTTAVNAVVVLLNNTSETDSVRDYLVRALPSEDFEVKTWEELADFYRGTAALYARQFAVLDVIVVVLVLLSVSNTVNMTIHERMGEFGVMRALGRRGRSIFGLVVIETVILGGIGAVLGVVAGVALAITISAIGIPMPPPPNAEMGFTATIRLTPQSIALAFSLGWSGAVLASLLSALKVARVPVVEALRRVT